MEESNVRTKKSHQETKNQESVIEDFIITNIKTKTVHINTTRNNDFAKVHQSLKNSDLYKPIVINNLIHANNLINFLKITKHLLDEGLPFNFSEFSIYHLKLSFSGPHPAVHFLWKQPVADTSCSTAQLKLIHNLKSQSKTYYTCTMKIQIGKTILKIGIIKHFQVNFIIKDLLGDESAANDE